MRSSFLLFGVLVCQYALAHSTQVIRHGNIIETRNRGSSEIDSNDVVGQSSAAQSLLQKQPLFSGQIVAGRRTGELSEDITPEAIKAMTDCEFYKDHSDSCFPTDPTTPCRYCKEKSLKLFGSPECPPATSFPIELRSVYEWRIKPIKTTTTFKKIVVCMTHELPKATQQANAAAIVQQQANAPVLSVALTLLLMAIPICWSFC